MTALSFLAFPLPFALPFFLPPFGCMWDCIIHGGMCFQQSVNVSPSSDLLGSDTRVRARVLFICHH